MKRSSVSLRRLRILGLSLLLALPSAQLLAQSDRGQGYGQLGDLIRELVSREVFESVKGRILTRRIVHYTGDPLEISLVFYRGADLVQDGDMDAYILIFTPGAEEESVVVPVSQDASVRRNRLFRIDAVDLSTLPAGWYQLGLVLTEPGGDPRDVDDWHNGLRGLLHVVGIVVTDEAVSYDQDGDGMVDDDIDGDGFSDADDDLTDEDVTDEDATDEDTTNEDASDEDVSGDAAAEEDAAAETATDGDASDENASGDDSTAGDSASS